MKNHTWQDVRDGIHELDIEVGVEVLAYKIAFFLEECKLPPCHISAHGSASMVMSWVREDILLSGTVTANAVHVLASSHLGIFFRHKIDMSGTSDVFSKLDDALSTLGSFRALEEKVFGNGG